MRAVEQSEGVSQAMEILHRAVTSHGFVASTTQRDNYRRIWARDGCIVAVSVLQTDDVVLHQAAYRTLATLRDHQGPHGEIPSNVDPESQQVSYGGTAGRVDANLWFVIGCYQYWLRTKDSAFLADFLPGLQRVEFLLGAWEFNTKGLLYVPETGDWADEYLQHGYVLYDQLLYYRALLGLEHMYAEANTKSTTELPEKARRLRQLIQANYWFYDCDPDEAGAYHTKIFKHGCDLAEQKGSYWMSYFSPTGYGYRFDAMANVLASLFGIATRQQSDHVDAYLADNVLNSDCLVLPAFSPVIEPIDEDWEDLQSTFSNTFKNKPYEFHNGGLWPLITGFYVADLVARGKGGDARHYLQAIHAANKLGEDDDQWGFYEYMHGKTLQPGGTRHQTWSASAAVLGHYALAGRQPFADIS